MAFFTEASKLKVTFSNGKVISNPKNFRVNDIVVFKSWDEMLNEYGYAHGMGKSAVDVPFYFIEGMINLIGEQYVIRAIVDEDRTIYTPNIRLCLLSDNNKPYPDIVSSSISEEMLKLFVPTTPKILLNSINFEEKMLKEII